MLIAIVGLPRSGTTVLTSVLSVHSQVSTLYEPWNASRQRHGLGESMDFDSFVETFVRDDQHGPVLLIKETATELHYLRHIHDLFRTASQSVDRKLIVILRNPFHVFLSEVQARREWWGAEDLEIDATTFSRWAVRTLASFELLAEMAQEQNALLVSYDSFTREPEAVPALTRALGLEPETVQSEFEKHVDRSAVRGDNRVAQKPRPISDRSVHYRTSEFEQFADVLCHSPHFATILRFAQAFAELPAISLASSHPGLMRIMRPA